MKLLAILPLGISLGLLGPAAPGHVVTQKDKKFSHQRLEVKAGAEVQFRNADEVVHNVYSISSGMEFNLKMQEPGTASSYTFAKPGTAEVGCVFHPGMKMTVVVR